jgi:hypothetical protein
LLEEFLRHAIGEDMNYLVVVVYCLLVRDDEGCTVVLSFSPIDVLFDMD